MSASPPELRQHDNGVWYIHWSEKRRSKRHSTGKKVLADAQAYFAHWLLAERQIRPESAASTLKVAEIWGEYFTRHVLAETVAVETAEWAWKNLKVHFADLTLPEITQQTIDDYEKRRAVGASKHVDFRGALKPGIGRPARSSTVRRELAALRASWGWASDPKRKIILPADLPVFDLPDEGEARDRWLRRDEIDRLFLSAAERRGNRMSRVERFLWLALETAARKTAIYELTWDRVDFEAGVIDFNVPGRRRTKKRRAVVPISDALMPVLRRMYAERLGDTNGFVLDHSGDIRMSLERLAAHAKVPDVSPHVLRHTAATNMARNGVPLWTIANILGNTLAMVERVYAKWSADAGRAAVNKISGLSSNAA